ncbi:hypothetical protein D3C85_643070 [compost metagenome]
MNIARFKHLFILSGMALLAVGGIVFDRPAYTKGVSYHGINNIVLNSGEVIHSEERLIIGDTLSLAVIDKSDANLNYASLSARAVSFGRTTLELEIQQVQSSRRNPPSRLSEVPDVFFGRLYGLATGAALHLEFLPTQVENTICYHTRELDYVRCLSR